MFFKRLEMTGFKSFALKTVLEFMPGVTVVVGPNGCGKSNVLDGIRWVLGEQSAKTLRGGRMGDVIFNGSASLKPLGYSQIQLTLANEERRLPLDQSEIQLSRRLYRTGESEYQLNRVNCRLKDITELFLDTGVGLNAYSIMEQGRVDQIINAKPWERREIFEEAAGISKYKIRREEALRKLARTQDDLLRIHDIIGEVERSCNSLKRQAQKAARYRRLKERERDLEQRLLVRRADLSRIEYKIVCTRYRESEDRLQALNAQLARLEAGQAEEQRKQQEFQKELQKNQSHHYALRTELDRAVHDRDLARERLESAKKRIEEIERELASMGHRTTVLTATLKALGAEAETQDATVRQKREELAGVSRKYEEARRALDLASMTAGQLRSSIASMTRKKMELENDERLAGHLVETLEKELETQAIQATELTKQVDELTQQAEKRRLAVETIEKAAKAIAEQRQTLNDEIARHKAEQTELQTRLEALTRKHHETRSRLSALKELETAYEGYFRGVKEVMKASGAGRLGGVIGVVSGLIGISKEHEIALEVVLGSQVQDIVTATVEDAKAAIEFLKTGNLGRATFLPLDFLEAEIKDDHLRPLLLREGVIGFARELVTYEPRLEMMVRYLLGSTLIVDTVDVAIGLKREGHRTRYVSLEGELVHPAGVLTGGSHQSRGLLSRVREIRQLETDAASLDKELESLRSTLKATNDRLNQSFARSAELQQEAHNRELELGAARKDHESLLGTLRDRRNQLAQLEARQSQRRAECARHRETRQKSQEAVARLGAETESKQAELTRLENEYSTRQEEVESLGKAVTDRRVELTALSERLTALREKMASLESDMTSARENQTVKSSEKTDLDEDARIQSDRITEAERQMVEMTRHVEEAAKKVSLQTQDIETLDITIKRQGSEIQEILRDRNSVDNEVRESQLRRAELKTRLEFLERESQEKFGLKIEEIEDEIKAREAAVLSGPVSGVSDEENTEEGMENRPVGDAAAIAAVPGDSTQVAADSQIQPGAPGQQTTEGQIQETASRESTDSQTQAGQEISEVDLNDPETLSRLLTEVRDKIAKLGNVNTTAIEEYEEKRQRLDYLTTQEKDLVEAKQSLENTITSLDDSCTKMFAETFEKIRGHFVDTFRRLFNGGRADLVLQAPEPGADQLEAGIEIMAQPPGKKLQSITLMSGGEKALTAVSLMFALFLHKPSPFCVLDEIDAPLDDTNVGRLSDMIREFSQTTQFVIITHNKITMSLADTIYGVTMQEPGVSKIVSVKFEEAVADRLLTGRVAG